MSAYVLVDITVNDAQRYESYKQMAEGTVTLYGGRYPVRGGRKETLEGEWPLNRFVVLEFPDAARAREWWASAEYAAAKALRQEIADTRMILVEGV